MSAANAVRFSGEVPNATPVRSAGVRIRGFESTDAAPWDEFVRSHPHGSPFHLTAWKTSIEQTFGYQPVYLVAESAGSICGVLPLFYVQTLLTGRALISTPFAVYGGALVTKEEARVVLANAVRRLGIERRVSHVELRNAWPEQCLGFAPLSRYVTFTQNVNVPEDHLLTAIPRKTRRMVRKALENGFETRVHTGDGAVFEDLYQKSLQRLGTPAFPSAHFRHLRENFGDSITIRETVHGNSVVAAVMSFHFGDQVLPYYGASDPAANALAPNNHMYFDLMRWASGHGYRFFDFGRSKKNTPGSYEFKSHWGMVERDLPYEILLVRRRKMPNLTPANAIFRWPRKLWGMLPVRVARTLGPALVRLVP